MDNKINICKDADKVLENFIKELDIETSHHRMINQENKCGYGLQGICCRLCSNGPCRISPARPRGVCGADADTIAVRNFLRSVAAGSGCYIHVVENAAKQLKKAAREKTAIKGKNALLRLADMLDVKGGSDWDKAEKIADKVLQDLYRPADENMELVKKVAYPMRSQIWEKTGILPGGAKDEIFNALVKTSTNLNSDPADMLKQCLRLGISTGVYGLVLTNLINDVLMGEGEISFEPVGIQVIDPECINIMITGHQHALFGDLQEYLVSEDVMNRARAEGAKAVKLVGCTCVGQDFQLRKAAGTDAFCGHAGNNYTSEAVLATGCVDLIVSEFNCTLPGIEPVCDKFEIPQICLDDVAKKSNADYIRFTWEEREEISRNIVSRAIESFKSRRNSLMPDDTQKLAEVLSCCLAGNEPDINTMQEALSQIVSHRNNSYVFSWGKKCNHRCN